MVFSEYLLIFWTKENKHSCVGRTAIVDGCLRKESDEKLKAIAEIEIVFNRKVYSGKVIHGGPSVREVNAYLKTIEEEEVNTGPPEAPSVETAKTKKRKHKSNIVGIALDDVIESVEKSKNAAKASNMSTTVEDVNMSAGTTENAVDVIESVEKSKNAAIASNGSTTAGEVSKSGDTAETVGDKRIEKLERKLKRAKTTIATLKEELSNEKALSEKFKSKTTNLRKKLQKFQEDNNTSVDIGNGVKLNAALLDRAKIFSTSPAVLGRNVFRLAFDENQIIGRSLFGRVCNANKLLPAKPSVDPLKRDAVINYCISVVEGDCKQSGLKFYKLAVKSKISKSLGEYIREITIKSNQEHDFGNENAI